MAHLPKLIHNISWLYLASDDALGFRKGNAMSNLPKLADAFVLISPSGTIEDFGPANKAPRIEGQVIDAKGGIVLPGFVDCHTHLVFADWRESEFVDRLQGLSYQEIAEKGGGILNSARKLSALPEEELYRRSLNRLKKAIQQGTGAIEIKSGYGLDTDAELKILRVIQKLKKQAPIPIRSTFLGAHAYPAAYKENHKAYIDKLTKEMMPRIAAEGLADNCDVFCERGFFNIEESDEILSHAARLGFNIRIHTNQFTHSGGIPLAIRHKAKSVDHLEVLNDEEIEQLLHSETHPVLLPSAAFFMRQEYPPARKMIDRGLGVILASDFNPGTSPSSNMAFVWSLACIQMKMLPEEALCALTINPAYSLGLEQELGSIERGKVANLIVTNPCSQLSYLPYSFGDSWISMIFIRGNPEFLGLNP